MEVSVPRLIGSANAATQPGSLTFEVLVRPAGGSSYVLQRRYKEFAQLQAELIRNGQISSPVLIPISKSAGVESRREACDALLRSMTHGVAVVESVGVFLETLAPSVDVEANGTFARPTSAEPASRPRSRSAEPPRRQSRSSTNAASPPASPMGLEAILDMAVSTGMTTPELAGKMHDNVRSGKFTEDHYVRLWSKRLSDASDASGESGASVAARPDDSRSSSRVCVARTAAGRLAASAAAAAVSPAATSIPSLGPRTPGYSPGRMSSRAPDSAIPASPAPSAEEVAALLQEALSLGLTTPPLLERMLDNMRHGRFTPAHYHKLFAQQVVEKRAASQSFAGSPTFASPDGAGAAFASPRRASLSSPPRPELAAPAGRPGEEGRYPSWARVQAQRQAQAQALSGGSGSLGPAAAAAGTSPARRASSGEGGSSPTPRCVGHQGASFAASFAASFKARAEAEAAAGTGTAAAGMAAAGRAEEPRRQSLDEYRVECLRLDAEEEARLEAEALGVARAAAKRRESIEAERLAAEAVVAKAARAEAAKVERAAAKARAKAEAEALQAEAEAEAQAEAEAAAAAAAAAVGSITIAAASGYSSRTSELLSEIVRGEVSAAHDGVQGAALDAAVYSVLRPGGVKVHELAAASPAAMPGGGCYSARTLAYLTAQQAAYRPPSPPYLPAAAFNQLSAAEKANYEIIPQQQQQPSAVRRPGLRGVGPRRAKAPSPQSLVSNPRPRPYPNPHPNLPPAAPPPLPTTRLPCDPGGGGHRELHVAGRARRA